MPVDLDYAEPTKLQDFKAEVFRPGSDTPVLVKPINSSTYQTAPGTLTAPNRDSGLGQPSNLPQRQNSLRFDGQYRTIDITPNNSAAAPQAKRSNQLGQSQFSEQAAYYAGAFFAGAIDGARGESNPFNEPGKKVLPHLEDMAYRTGHTSGKEIRDLTRDAIKNGQKTFDDLWRNRPTFEIPQTKIPKIDFPELPSLDIPDFPEFDFPKISFPKPQPIKIPKPTPVKQPKPTFDPTRYGHCGTLSLNIAMGVVRLGTKYNEEGRYFESITQPVSVDEIAAIAIKCNPAAYKTIEDVLSVGGTGTSSRFKVGNSTIDIDVSESVSINHDCSPTFYGYKYPTYFISQRTVTIYDTESGTLSEVLSMFAASGLTPEVTSLSGNRNDSSCQFPPKSPPPKPTPPPPPPERDCCRMGCCPKPTEINYKLIKALVDQTLKEQKFVIDVPICQCEFNRQANKWLPKTNNVIMEVFATSFLQAQQLSQIHIENARQAADLCLARNTQEPVAAIPQSWQIRHEGGKPQLVIQCAERKKDGSYGSAMYPITVPHWKGKVTDKISLPSYKKGNWEGIFVLADNTKITINAANEAECIKILNAIKPWIDKEMLKDSYFKGGKINIDIKPTQVKPMYGRYFPTGQKDNKPAWRVEFS